MMEKTAGVERMFVWRDISAWKKHPEGVVNLMIFG
jgi:hypothetical protein